MMGTNELVEAVAGLTLVVLAVGGVACFFLGRICYLLEKRRDVGRG